MLRENKETFQGKSESESISAQPEEVQPVSDTDLQHKTIYCV